MSNQFSYELDERQIRIMLRDGEAEYDPAAWSRFEQLAQPDAKPRQASMGPRFNLSISRSVVVPLIFVVLIGGLSATLFSFVDFKKKEVKVSKNTPEPKSLNTPAKVEVPPAKPQPETIKSAPAGTVTAIPTPTVQQPAMTETKAAVLQNNPKPVEAAVVKTPASQATITSTASKPVVTAANSQAQPPVVKKRKQKKVVSEEIPTINTSSTNLNQGSQEPELELR